MKVFAGVVLFIFALGTFMVTKSILFLTSADTVTPIAYVKYENADTGQQIVKLEGYDSDILIKSDYGILWVTEVYFDGDIPDGEWITFDENGQKSSTIMVKDNTVL